MFKKHPFVPAKEKFISPRVSMTVGLEPEADILAGSPGTELMPSILSLGHEVDKEYDVNDSSYWE